MIKKRQGLKSNSPSAKEFPAKRETSTPPPTRICVQAGVRVASISMERKRGGGPNPVGAGLLVLVLLHSDLDLEPEPELDFLLALA